MNSFSIGTTYPDVQFFHKEKERIQLKVSLIYMGEDLCLCLAGGEKPHIGAVALATPYLSNTNKWRASASVLTVAGHKEDELSKKVAVHIATKTQKCVSVCCGIHLSNINEEELALIEQLVDQLTLEIIEKIMPPNKKEQ